MQDKKNQHILFSKTISVKQHERLSKLLKKYPYALNLHYKAIETTILLENPVDKSEFKKLSIYAIDKPFLKLKFKSIRKKGIEYLNMAHTESSEEKENNLPDVSSNNLVESPSTIDKPTPKANLIKENTVKQGIKEQNIIMASKNDDQKHADQAPQSGQFNDWLEGLNKSKRIEDIEEENEVILEKKARKKKKKEKKKAKKKYAKYVEYGAKQDDILSETLAELMAKQGYTDKAIEMYNRLSLLFPDKNSYFARKIEDLKQ